MTDEAPDDSWMPDGDAASMAHTTKRSRMKETAEDRAAKAKALGSTGQRILEYINRYEAEEADKIEAAARMKAVMEEAKGEGYNTKALKKIIADRKRNADEVREEEDTLRLYREAIGL
jgi:uncharacterized protein (UPF0335 family)